MNFDDLTTVIAPALSSFPQRRARGHIYVDKTALIYKLAKDDTPKFLSRPRRFGKSTIVSTLEELFLHGTKAYDGHDSYFKGLAIGKLWQDEGHYQVLHLDFHDDFTDFYDSAGRFKAKFRKVLVNFAASLNSSISPDSLEVSEALKDLLSGLPDNSLVLLIDEYDAPLTAQMQHPEEFEKFAQIMRGFYAVMKGHSAKFRCIFITGITRYKDASLFTAGNSITDISQDPVYGTIAGYTRDEIKKYYHDNLVYAAAVRKHISQEQVTDADLEALLDEMAEWYDGFYFDEELETHVFSTWSVLKFFLSKNAVFKNYWYEACGQPEILRHSFMRLKQDMFSLLRRKTTSVTRTQFSGPADLQHMEPAVLLCQTGYLTFARPQDIPGEYKLCFPNRELLESFTTLCKESIFVRKGPLEILRTRNLDEQKSAADIVGYLNEIFNATDYENSPVDTEGQVSNMLQLFFLGNPGYYPVINEHSAKGRADLIVRSPKRAVVLEFKLARDLKRGRGRKKSARVKVDYKKLLKQAREQLQDREYGRTVKSPPVRIFIAAVFSQYDKKLTHFCEYVPAPAPGPEPV